VTSRSPLHDLHAGLGARFTEFSGWEMPVQYESVLAEHRSVRLSAGWFDVSHLGRFRWEGEGATAALRRLLCNDVDRIEPGRTQYTMLLNDRGGIVDDLIVWRWDDESYWVLPNGGNHRRVMETFAKSYPEVEIEDLRPLTAAIAVQGPEAPGVLERVVGSAPRRFRTFSPTFEGHRVRGAGTGYTGEPGGEVVVDATVARDLADALIEAGCRPCGLGARDTLRLEAGLPLWGQDLDEDRTPLEAGLEFAVAWDHDFVGRAALETYQAGGATSKLVAFATEGRQIPRHGQRLRCGGLEGVVTSGNFSPMLERGIGLGYLPAGADGPVEVEIRERWVEAERVELPFYRRR
jgi:aminomethyltransferase